MNRTPDEWSKVNPDAVVSGSTARNRDMWKGQSERQAQQLSRRASTVASHARGSIP